MLLDEIAGEMQVRWERDIPLRCVHLHEDAWRDVRALSGGQVVVVKTGKSDFVKPKVFKEVAMRARSLGLAFRFRR